MSKHCQKGRARTFYRSLLAQFRTNRASFLLYIALRAVVSAIAVWQIVSGNYETAFYCLFTLVLFLLPPFVEKTFNIELPTGLEILVLIFIFAAQMLGELAEFYVKVPLWDTMLHTVCGFLSAAIGLSLIDLLNRSDRFHFQLSPFFVGLMSFCFSMTVGVLWEFFEFGMDVLFQTDMQKDYILNSISSILFHPDGRNTAVTISGITDVAVNGQSLGLGGYLDIGLYDTMKDLFVNFLGALLFSVFGYFYTKHRGNSRSAKVVQSLQITRKDPQKPTE